MLSSRLRKPTFRQIEAFRAVMMAGSMKDAAHTLSISQPAVSKIIKSLEEDLGLRLFLRKRGGLQASEAALMLYENTHNLFAGLEEVGELALQLRERRAGHLRIAAMSAMSLNFLPGIVGAFLKSRPGVSVVLDTHNSAEVIRHVRARRYDLGIAMPPVLFEGVEVTQNLFARCVCILPSGHRLGARRTCTPESLRDTSFISLAEESLTRSLIDEAFASRDVSRHLRVSARSPETVASFVRSGLGVAIIDPFTAQQHKACGGLVRPFSPVIASSISLVRPKGAESTKLLEDFVSHLELAASPFALSGAH